MRFLDPIKSLIFAHDWIAPALDKFPEFSHEDILKWAELFRVYDYDGSGTISVGELRCVFKDQGMEISRDQAYDYFRLVGVNPDTDDLTWLDYLDVMRFVGFCLLVCLFVCFNLFILIINCFYLFNLSPNLEL